MRVSAWLALAVALVLVIAVIALDRMATRYVNRPDVRAGLETQIDAALGREVAYEELGVSVLPPSVVVLHARVAGETPDAPPLLVAEKISLRVALVPLLARVVVIDSLVVDGARLRLVRARAGLLLPQVGRAAEQRRESAGKAGEESGYSLALRRFELRDAVVDFEDRLLTPPRQFQLRHVHASLVGSALRSAYDVAIEVSPRAGGRLRGRGTATREGKVDLALELEGFPLAPLVPYVSRARALAGRVFGRIDVHGPAADPDPLTATLEVRDARLELEELSLVGRVALQLTYHGGQDPQRAEFSLDATDAELRVGDVFAKPPGRRGTLAGNAAVRPDGHLAADDVVLRILDAEAHGRFETGPRLRVQLRVPPTELVDWQPLFAALGDTRLAGAVEVVGVEIATNPLEVHGEARADAVEVRTGERAFDVTGTLAGDGTTLRSRALTLTAGGQSLPVEVEVADLDESWRYDVRVRAEGVDSARLLAAVSGHGDTLHGPLDASGDFTGTLAGETSRVDALRGRARLDIAPGRLTGLNILRATLQELDVAGVGKLLGRLPVPGRSSDFAQQLERYYSDRFDSLGATLEVQGGTAHTSDFRLVTPYYVFELDGAIGLRDLALDAHGQLVLGREITREIAHHLGIGELPVLDGVVIPLPTIGGTLTEPRPDPDFSLLLRALLGNLPGLRQVDRFFKNLTGMGRQ